MKKFFISLVAWALGRALGPWLVDHLGSWALGLLGTRGTWALGLLGTSGNRALGHLGAHGLLGDYWGGEPILAVLQYKANS
jgi:hypothetical protein